MKTKGIITSWNDDKGIGFITYDSLGAKFQSTKNFIELLESISYRFLTQVIEPMM